MCVRVCLFVCSRDRRLSDLIEFHGLDLVLWMGTGRSPDSGFSRESDMEVGWWFVSGKRCVCF